MLVCVVGAVLWWALFLGLHWVRFLLLWGGLWSDEGGARWLLAVDRELLVLIPLVPSLLVGTLVALVLGRRSVLWATTLGPSVLILETVPVWSHVGFAVAVVDWLPTALAYLALATAGGYAGGRLGSRAYSTWWIS